MRKFFLVPMLMLAACEVVTTPDRSKIEGDADTDSDTDTEEGTELDSDSATEADSDSATEADTDSATEADTDSATEADTDSATEMDTDSATEADTDSATEMDTDSATEMDTDSATEADTDSATEMDTDSATEMDTDSATEMDSDSATEMDSDSATDADTSTEPDSDSDTVISTSVGDACTYGDGLPGVLDCELVCRDEGGNGDGSCDDTVGDVNFYCEEFDYDGGDCVPVPTTGTPGETCTLGVYYELTNGYPFGTFDCGGLCYPSVWIGDNICDNNNSSLLYADFYCDLFSFDEGDCDEIFDTGF